MTVEFDSALDQTPDFPRIRSRRLVDGIASIVADASGLTEEERQALEHRLRLAALAAPGVKEARVALTTAKPLRKLVAIGSGKGGVGKSTLAANLAVALARRGRKVGLIDGDIQGPSQTRLFGTDTKPSAKDKQLIPVETQGIRLLSIGMMVPEGQALAWRGPMVSGALGQLVDADWGDAELILVDLPPGTGDIQLSLIQKARPAGALIVSTPQDLALMDATRAIDLFRKTEVPVLGLVENMAGYVCPHCGESSDPFGSGGVEAAARNLEVPFLGRLPLSLSLREASDAGHPPVAGKDVIAEQFDAIAGELLTALDTPAG